MIESGCGSLDGYTYTVYARENRVTAISWIGWIRWLRVVANGDAPGSLRAAGATDTAINKIKMPEWRR